MNRHVITGDGWGILDQKSELESARQIHDIVGIDPGFECLQIRQIVPININERSFGAHIVSVQCQRVIGQYSLCLGNGREAIRRFFHSRNELAVIERVVPAEVYEERIGSLAWLASRWSWKG